MSVAVTPENGEAPLLHRVLIMLNLLRIPFQDTRFD